MLLSAASPAPDRQWTVWRSGRLLVTKWKAVPKKLATVGRSMDTLDYRFLRYRIDHRRFKPNCPACFPFVRLRGRMYRVAEEKESSSERILRCKWTLSTNCIHLAANQIHPFRRTNSSFCKFTRRVSLKYCWILLEKFFLADPSKHLVDVVDHSTLLIIIRI